MVTGVNPDFLGDGCKL